MTPEMQSRASRAKARVVVGRHKGAASTTNLFQKTDDAEYRDDLREEAKCHRHGDIMASGPLWTIALALSLTANLP